MPGISLVITLGMAVVIDHGPVAVGPIPFPPPVTCPAQPPVEPTDWKPMLAALKRFIARELRREPRDPFAPVYSELIRRFERCWVHVQPGGDLRDLLVTANLGGLWAGAHFRKTAGRWIVLDLDSGDNS